MRHYNTNKFSDKSYVKRPKLNNEEKIIASDKSCIDPK